MRNVFTNLWLVLILALTAGIGVWANGGQIMASWEAVWYLLVTAILCSFVMLRRSTAEVDRRMWMYCVCAISLCYAFAYKTFECDQSWWTEWAYYVRIIIQVMADITLLSLGRSFAILPAVREITTSGLYRVVRHPVYSLYIVADIVFVILQPSCWNLAVAIIGTLSLICRIFAEEALLLNNNQYKNYYTQVRWRLFPLIW